MITIDPAKEPGIAALVVYARDFLKSGDRGDFKVYVRDGDVTPIVEKRITEDMMTRLREFLTDRRQVGVG
jgi:hypothetical protein